MDATQFDDLVQSLTYFGSRRGLLRLLTILPLGGVPAFVAAEAGEAAKRHHRTSQHHHKPHHDQLQAQRKKRKKCARAGQTTSKKRKACCAGLVRDASGVCSSATPSSPPASPPPPPPPGCTPATCGPNACGSVPDGCGGTLSCGGCAGDHLCIASTCQPCDVCPSGCFFSSVQEAIDAASGGETIRICAGLYPGTIVVDKNVTLIGAGDSNGAGSTILQKVGTDVAAVATITSGHTVRLHNLRITGGAGASSGGGILNFGTLDLTDCTITRNTANDTGGGIHNEGGALTLNGSTVSANTGVDFGGGIASFDGTVELINSTISGNSADVIGGGIVTLGGATVTLDAASRVTGNQANRANPDSGGGIFNVEGTVTLSTADNVTGNTPDNCGGIAVPLCNG